MDDKRPKRELVAGNYKDAILSGMGDTLDVIGSTSLTKRIGKGLITRVGNRNIYTYSHLKIKIIVQLEYYLQNDLIMK